MAISDEKKALISKVLSEWDNISDQMSDSTLPYDWRSAALQGIRTGNVNKMKAQAAPLAEFKVMEIMQNSASEALQLDAAKFVLGQTGHGTIQKVENTVMYEKMEPDQLVAILNSKMAQIRQLSPGIEFSLPKIVEAELVESDKD